MHPRRIVFVDPMCPKPYETGNLEAGALGGTEATIIRVANGLARSEEVIVLQHCRAEAVREERLTYAGFTFECGEPDAFVVLRDPSFIPRFRKQFPRSRCFLWHHNWLTERESFITRSAMHHMLAKARCTPVCVSEAHVTNLTEHAGVTFLNRWFGSDTVRPTFIHNPIDDDLCVDDTPVDPNKVVFFSSALFGRLETVLTAFSYVRRSIPELTLYLANPGYLAQQKVIAPGVIDLGALPHREIVRHVRGALCTFYAAQTPEAFGLVFAESNAVGTPVLAHRCGAAPEVMSNWSQFVDVSNLEKVTDTLRAWRAGARPTVSADERFRLSSVVRKWKDLLAQATAESSRAASS